MNSKEIKQKFLDFFQNKEHREMPPAGLVSLDDPSVLFTTAGMQQFKKYYLNPQAAPARRVVTIQPCVRTTDIEEVGNERHLTYFEMLGNFSFDDYFKKEAIEWAWEFLTGKQWLNIAPKRISATYFSGNKKIPEDEESKKILENIKELGGRIKAQGEDNFWTLGTENSPAGPTVEFYACPEQSREVNNIEIWNLVFNEYIYQNDEFRMTNSKGVDTGLGLERLLAVINGYDSVYDTDVYENPKSKIQNPKWGVKDQRILLDHLRASEALANEGLLPSNKEQGYVLRRLIRKMVLVCKRNDLDFHQITDNKIILDEFQKFNQTLERGEKLFDKIKILTAENLFDLYQSYGFPIELSLEEAILKKIKIEEKAREKFEVLLKKHQELSRTASAGMFHGGLENQSANATKYHTATHLLLAALKKVLDKNIEQKGSNITNERLRFDFNFERKLTNEEIKKIEELVNRWISEKLPIEKEEMTLEEARKSNATGVFGEKYGDKVTVYSIIEDPSTRSARSGSREPISRELCGGPHVVNTGELGHFKIQKEESSSAGVRRIKAILI